jgi:hypothetical protein
MQNPITYSCLQFHNFEELIHTSMLVMCVLNISALLDQKSYAVAQSFEALRYKLRGTGFDSRGCD